MVHNSRIWTIFIAVAVSFTCFCCTSEISESSPSPTLQTYKAIVSNYLATNKRIASSDGIASADIVVKDTSGHIIEQFYMSGTYLDSINYRKRLCGYRNTGVYSYTISLFKKSNGTIIVIPEHRRTPLVQYEPWMFFDVYAIPTPPIQYYTYTTELDDWVLSESIDSRRVLLN